MLDPDRRHLLIDALRPPPGAQLDAAVGTTFSLDLEALLIAPIAFALFEARLAETDDTSRSDPLAVMEAVRRHADLIDIFYQAGEVALPPRDQPVLAMLEKSVHPTSAPTPGFIFHPKVWVLRYRSASEITYRVLVLTRNLTFDRSWDLIVALDGERGELDPALRDQNRPLSDFIRSLPDRTTRPVEAEHVERIQQLAAELLGVRWQLPEGFNEVRFHPTGIGGYQASWPDRADKVLIVSPFLTRGHLETTLEKTGEATLVSRPESLDRIDGELLDRFHSLYVLADRVDQSLEEDRASGVRETELTQTTAASAPTREEVAERPGMTGAGIHAKLLVVDQGWYSELRLGSTNATTAGWSGNVEFDLALFGAKKRMGVDAILGLTAASPRLLDMLGQYHRSNPEPVPELESERLAYELGQLAREIASLPLLARVEGEDADLFRIILNSDRPLPRSDGATIRCWPSSRPRETATTQAPGQPVHVSVGGLSLQSLTSFFAFEITAESSEGPVSVVTVGNARLVGAPEDRHQRLLLEQLRTKGDVLRYLLFLLADLGDDSAIHQINTLLSGRGTGSDGDWAPAIPLFESMVRALSRNPDALGPINRLITDLQETPEGRQLLPDGLDEVWPAIWEAREALR